MSQDPVFVLELPVGLDSWCYKVSTDPNNFGKTVAYIDDGQRTVHRLVCEGEDAFRKWDHKERGRVYADGPRDKVAADLAQLIAANVPGTLLWKQPDASGCVQKAPPHFNQSLKMVLRAMRADDDPDSIAEIKMDLANAYDPINVFLDVWLGNVDRHVNYGNTLICESSCSSMVWIIDFNNSLGHEERPWGKNHFEEHGFAGLPAPVPMIVVDSEEWVQRVLLQADDLQQRLSNVDDELIRGICQRAFDGCSNVDVELIVECLVARKIHIKEWTCQLLTAA